MINWLTKQISKYESFDNNNKEVKSLSQNYPPGYYNATS
ncbi:MAG: hypothetical protein K0S91_3306 [Nitrososphaeraceae archaeon]|nr:hypothetical protein [Nitrososphaeraceae archaeon]